MADVSQFVEALERVARGTALDPEVVTQLMGASRRRDSIFVLTAREKDVLSLMAEGGPIRPSPTRSVSPRGRSRSM